MHGTDCARDDDLRAFLLGELPDELASALTAHLEACPRCEAAARRLDAMTDPAVRALRRALGRPLAADPADATPPIDSATVPVAPQAGASGSDPLPAAVAGYTILARLGRGGMGVVYKARQQRPARLVALKMLPAGEGDGAAWRGRLLAEAEALARLQHPHIVQIHGVGEQDGRVYLVLEFAANGSLAERLKGAPLSPAAAAGLVRALAEAVHYAHGQGIVHRDLKPSNILLQAPGLQPEGFGIPKVADFGLARLLGDGAAHLTLTGMVLGTPSYMAPEQADGQGKEAGPACDVYALGAILYECLTGRPPFLAASPAATLQQVLIEEPAPPARLNRQVPRDLETVCLKCLSKEPQRRYASAAALADDLGRALEGRPILARPVGATERAGRWARRNPGLAAALLATAVALVAVSAVSVAFAVHAARAADREARAADDLRREEAQKTAALEQTGAALRDVQQQRQRADERTRLAEHRLAENYFDRGLALCSGEGDAALGLLWLAKALEVAAGQDDDLEWAIRVSLAAWRSDVPALRALMMNGRAITCLALSPDGQTALVGSDNGLARLWDLTSGKPRVAMLQPPLGSLLAVAFSPDGRTALVGGTDGARQWDAATGRPLGEPMRHGDSSHPVTAVAFSPDRKTVLLGGADGVARLWDVATGRPRGEALRHPKTVLAAAFSPDGKTVLTSSDDWVARLWDASTGRPKGEPLRHGQRILALAFSPDSQTALTGSWDNTARLWDAATGKPRGEPLRHAHDLAAVAFSPDGRVVATADIGGAARLWDAAGRPLGDALPIQMATRVTLAFSPDGRTLLTGSSVVRLWDAATGRPLGPPLRQPTGSTRAAFSPDGKTFLVWSSDGATVRLWEVPPRRPHPLSLPHQNAVVAAAFSPDGRRVLTGSWDRTARLWDAATGQPSGPVLRHALEVHAVAFSPDGQAVAAGGREGVARVWDAATGEPKGEPLRHASIIDGVAFSPDGQVVLTVGGEHARLWDAATGQPRAVLGTLGIGGATAAFSPDGRTVLVGGPHPALWDADTGRLLARFPRGYPAHGVAFSPDGRVALTGRGDGTAQLWDAANGQPLRAPFRHESAVTCVAFDPRGRVVLTASEDRTARLWDAATGVPVGLPLRHGMRVLGAAFSPDGRAVATCGADGTAQLWSAATGRPLGPPWRQGEGVFLPVVFRPGGRAVLTGSYTADAAARLWDVPAPLPGTPERIKVWARVLTGMDLDDQGAMHFLDPSAWEQDRRRLAEQGGPP